MSCSNIPEDTGTAQEEAVLMPRRRKVVDHGICIKCKEKRGKIVRLSISYCRECFLHQYTSRFLKLLHPPLYPVPTHTSRVPLPTGRPPLQPGNLVVGLSGGAGSMSMLHLLNERGYVGPLSAEEEGEEDEKVRMGSKAKRRGETWRRGWVVYVEFAGVIPGAPDRTEDMKRHVQSLRKGWEFVGLRAEDAFDETLISRLQSMGSSSEVATSMTASSIQIGLGDAHLPITTTPSPLPPLSRLLALLSSLPTSSHPHLLSNLLTSLLHLTTLHLPHISHLLLGETSTRQAEHLIAATATGGGWGLPLDLAGVRTHGGVVRVKPMREVLLKEAAYYCWVEGVEMVNGRRWGEGGGKGGGEARGKGGVGSLEKLTEDFITTLGVTHPSTVSTITRTGSKLTFRGASGDLESVCPLCGQPAEPSSLAWKARTALTSLPSHSSPTPSLPPPASDTSLAPLLCYACLTTLSGSTTAKAVDMPIWLGARIAQRLGGGVGDIRRGEGHEGEGEVEVVRGEIGRGEMREVVQEFLIGEDEDE